MVTAPRKFIEKEGPTQADAAKRLNMSQPRISDLTRGKISSFSLDTLVNMFTDAGLEVDFRIKPRSRRVAQRIAANLDSWPTNQVTSQAPGNREINSMSAELGNSRGTELAAPERRRTEPIPAPSPS